MPEQQCMISVIVPIYKVEEYLPKCIESILAYDGSDFELILVDDGSPDQCPEICDKYASRDKRIKVVHKRNGGAVSARKAGFACSCGKYVTFVDGDDWIDEQYLAQICEMLRREEPDVVAVTALYFAKNGENRCVRNGGQFKGLYGKEKLAVEFYPFIFRYSPDFCFGMAPSLCTKIIRREIIGRFLPNVSDDIRMGDDLAASLPCVLSAKNIYFTDLCGYYYRQNPTSMTNSFDVHAPERLCSLLKNLRTETLQFSVQNMQQQIGMYAVFMAKDMLVSLVKHSEDLPADLERCSILWDDPSLRIGMQEKIPFKVKMFIQCAKLRKVWLLRLFRRVKYGREANGVK